jgi:serine/threonine protein kinase
LKGLKHLHNLNILHRDIKLDNIMFGEENNIKSLKIIDFGCATFSDNNKRK